MEITSISTRQTQELADKLAEKLKPGDVLALQGDLGSGKTTFTSYLVRALGSESRVQSPSFVLVRRYIVPKTNGEKIRTIYHVDLYRLTSKAEVEDLGLEEMFSEEDALVIIEWPELAEDILPETSVKIDFEYAGENKRKINVQNTDRFN